MAITKLFPESEEFIQQLKLSCDNFQQEYDAV